MWDRLNKLLNWLTPAYDKLKHNYLSNLSYLVLLSVVLYFNLSLYIASTIVLIFTIVWEIIQKIKGGTNSLKEQLLDVFFSNWTHVIVTIILYLYKNLILCKDFNIYL